MEYITFEDPNTEKRIMKDLRRGKQIGIFSRHLTAEQAAGVTSLDIDFSEEKNLDFLRYFKNLRELNINFTKCRINAEGIGYCSNLEEFYADDVQLDGLERIVECRQLRVFEYAVLHPEEAERRTDFTFLTRLPNLESVYLENNLVEDVSFLAELPALSDLILDRNPIQSTEPLGRCESLVDLAINECGLRSLDGIERIPCLKNLEALDNQLTEEQIALYQKQFQHLAHLALSR